MPKQELPDCVKCKRFSKGCRESPYDCDKNKTPQKCRPYKHKPSCKHAQLVRDPDRGLICDVQFERLYGKQGKK